MTGLFHGRDERPSGEQDDRPALLKVRERLQDNGAMWTFLHVASRGLQRGAHWLDGHARAIERRKGRPGLNSVRRNREVWGGYDWSANGEEWTMSEPWRAGVVREFVDPYLPAGSAATVLEIGPGAGRWTETLQSRASRLWLVDLTETTLDLCRERLGDPDNTRYVLNDGASLPGVPDASIEFLWSFDVFVHIAPAEQRKYAAEFRRVLAPGGRAVIHHGGAAGLHGGWRSAMTGEAFRSQMEANGLRVVAQVDSWGSDGEFRPSTDGDLITVVEA